MTPKCAHCSGVPWLVTGEDVYPHRPELAGKWIWRCRCGARVGCHPGSSIPLGTLANATLRAERVAVHAVLDPIWQTADRSYALAGRHRDRPKTLYHLRCMARDRVYAWLANQMRLTHEQCHVGMFDIYQCREAIQVLRGIDYDHIRAWIKTVPLLKKIQNNARAK